MSQLYLDNAEPFDGTYRCNQCADHKRLKLDIARRRKKRAEIATYRDIYGKADDDSTTEEDTTDDESHYDYPHKRRPYKTSSRRRYLHHLCTIHNITGTDMRHADPPGLDGYIGTNYSLILSMCCTVCNREFGSIREADTHKNTEGAKEVELSIRNGITPTSTDHFTNNQINEHISKLKRQKKDKTDRQRVRRAAKRPPKPKYSDEIIAADKSCARAEQAIRENKRLTCRICNHYFNKKNYNPHCKSRWHRQELFERIILGQIRSINAPKWSPGDDRVPDTQSDFRSMMSIVCDPTAPEFIEEIVNIQEISSI
jgi:hypothetical protein